LLVAKSLDKVKTVVKG